MRVLRLALALAASGCTLINLTPQARFQDSAYTLNDAARWGQVDAASKHVSPKYLEKFVSRHQHWGEGVSIADADVVSMKVAEDKESATSEVSINWYDSNGISVRKSVISQTWETQRGNFMLVDEKIRSGDPRVFAEAPPES